MMKTRAAIHISCCILAIILSCQVSFAQRINLNITQREGGGESIQSVRRLPQTHESTNEMPPEGKIKRQRQRIVWTDDMPESWRNLDSERLAAFVTIEKFSRRVASDIKQYNRISPQTITDYRQNGYPLTNISPDKFIGYKDINAKNAWLYLRCGSMPITLPQEIEKRIKLIESIEGETPALLRYKLFWRMLLGDRKSVDAVIEKLQRRCGQQYDAWLKYIRQMAVITGHSIKTQFSNSNYGRLPAQGGPAKVLVFRDDNATGQQLIDQLGGYYGQLAAIAIIDIPLELSLERSREIQQINSRDKVNYAVIPPADVPAFVKDFNVTHLPTAVVLDFSGRVMYSGDARCWEFHRAITHAVKTQYDPIYVTAERELSGDGESVPPSAADEAAAKKMCDAAWDRARLGIRTNTPSVKQQAINEFREVIRLYPGTRGAREAADNLRSMGETP